jgi:isoquinoline 1-oxidoreductase alpha subunit
MIALVVNGKEVQTEMAPDTPLLWYLRDELGLTGTKFGCGIARCGSCIVHVNGAPTRSCVMPLSGVKGKKITTIEGLEPNAEHALQKAFVAMQVPQCGYCQSGQIMSAAALLDRNNNPTREEIIAHMSGNICRCGTYNLIIAAIETAAREIQALAPPPEPPEEEEDKSDGSKRKERDPRGRR